MELLNTRFWGNSAKEWLTALAVALSIVIALRLLKWVLVRHPPGAG